MSVFSATPMETIRGNLGMVGNSSSIREAIVEACEIAEALKMPVRFPFNTEKLEIQPKSSADYLMGRWAQRHDVTSAPVYTRNEYAMERVQIDPIKFEGSIDEAIKLACSTAVDQNTPTAVQCGDWVFLARIGQSPEYMKGLLDERLSPEDGPIQRAA